MDLTQASNRLRLAHERYETWRRARRTLRDHPGSGSPPTDVLEDCARLGVAIDGGPVDGRLLLAAVEVLEGSVKEERTAARRAYWYEQGKALRYSLVVLEHRIQQIEAETAVHGTTPESRAAAQAMRDEVVMVRHALEDWDTGPRRGERFCSLEDVERIIEEPYHDADKEQLERVVERAHTAQLPADLRCIRLVWDSLTGDLVEARILPTDQSAIA